MEKSISLKVDRNNGEYSKEMFRHMEQRVTRGLRISITW